MRAHRYRVGGDQDQCKTGKDTLEGTTIPWRRTAGPTRRNFILPHTAPAPIPLCRIEAYPLQTVHVPYRY
jgi:hypothetical protein